MENIKRRGFKTLTIEEAEEMLEKLTEKDGENGQKKSNDSKSDKKENHLLCHHYF